MHPVFTVDEMKQQIASVLLSNDSLIEFTYSVDHFGNMVVKIRRNRETHIFTTDRGEIYHNTKMLCDSSYLDKEDTFTKLLQMISKEMNQ